MNAVEVRGTTDPTEIAVALAVLRRCGDRDAEALFGLKAWRVRRRDALTPGTARRPRTTTTPG